MIEETKKSIQSILSQRISSPFYGTLVISWLLMELENYLSNIIYK
jgi:hypothetical protein